MLFYCNDIKGKICWEFKLQINICVHLVDIFIVFMTAFLCL